MKKYLFIISLILPLIIICSCTPEKEDNKYLDERIVGSWVNGIGVLTFNEEGEFTYINVLDYESSGVFITENNVLTYIYQDGSRKSVNYKIPNKNELYLESTKYTKVITKN